MEFFYALLWKLPQPVIETLEACHGPSRESAHATYLRHYYESSKCAHMGINEVACYRTKRERERERERERYVRTC